MKLVNVKKNGNCALGVRTPSGIRDVSALSLPEVPKTMRQALELGLDETLRRLSPVFEQAPLLKEEDAVFAPVVTDPEKILCVGKNYRAHVAEMTETELFKRPNASPEIFAKFRNTLVPHGGSVRLNPFSRKHDYEAEIAVVIGRRASRVSEEAATDYIFGYTLANDISARDLQKAASQWTPGKTCDTFCPLGPCLVTADELAPDGIVITGYKNGELRQSGCSREMIYSIPYIVSFLSHCCTLEPGDLILTGTPAGVIMGRPAEKQDWLRAGDTLSVCSDEIGTLTVTVTEE